MSNERREEIARIVREAVGSEKKANDDSRPTCVIHNLYLTVSVAAPAELDAVLARLRSLLSG